MRAGAAACRMHHAVRRSHAASSRPCSQRMHVPGSMHASNLCGNVKLLVSPTWSLSLPAAGIQHVAPAPSSQKLHMTAHLNQPLPHSLASYAGSDANVYLRRGMEMFKRGLVAESLRDFDKVLDLSPSRRPHLWQRGLSLFYEGHFDDAAEQFEQDAAVYKNDAEESIWRWLAQVRRGRLEHGLTAAQAIDAARQDMLHVDIDERPVMRVAMALFDGSGSVDVLNNAGGQLGSDFQSAPEAAHDRFYADLYLGLWHEASEDSDDQARDRIARAIASPYKATGDYMWYVATVHASLRGWLHYRADL